MAKIHGYAAHASGAELLPFQYEPGKLKPQEVEIAVSHCGVCHSDLHLIDNDWGFSVYPLVPGHEIVGVITETGPAVQGFKAGDRVGVGWQSGSCGHCEWCQSGEENLCAALEGVCTGGRHGGYADRVRVNARFVVPLPEALKPENAAPLLCGGITVYNPLRLHGVSPASRVGIVGIGGLGHLAIQFARAFGAEVTAFSSSANKEEEARTLGAHHFVNTRQGKPLKDLEGTFDLILTTSLVEEDVAPYAAALRRKGVLHFAAARPAPASVAANSLLLTQKTLTGSMIGSPHMMREMLDVAARHRIHAVTEVFPIGRVNEALGRLRKNQIRYRAVLAL